MTRYLFTLTAGRTGTAWLAKFLEASTKHRCIHEVYGIDHLGVTMPDIKIMQTFNNRGNNDYIRSFWKQKFSTIQGRPIYVETNHTLGKCGLIENLALSEIVHDTTVVILRRNLISQCASYMMRGDFVNDTIASQWYLFSTYAKNLVGGKPFSEQGQLGVSLWYYYEMTARQEYYKRLFNDRLNFVDVYLEDIVTEPGGKSFFESLNLPGSYTAVPPQNQSTQRSRVDLHERINDLVRSYKFDAEEIVDNALRQGKSFEF